LTNQSPSSANGIWVAKSASPPARPSDFASGSQVLARSVRVTGSASAASTNDGTTWFLNPELSRNDRYQPAPLAYPSAHCGRQHRSNRDPKPGFSVHDPPRNGRQLRGLGRWKHLPPVELRLELRHARNRRRLRSGSRRARLGGIPSDTPTRRRPTPSAPRSTSVHSPLEALQRGYSSLRPAASRRMVRSSR